jgi:hypothetical protein
MKDSDFPAELFFWSWFKKDSLYEKYGHLPEQTIISASFAYPKKIPSFEVTSNSDYLSCFRLSLNNTKSDMSTSDSLQLTLFTDSYMTENQPLNFVNKSLHTLYYTPNEFGEIGPNGIALVFTAPGEYPDVESHSVMVRPEGNTVIKLKMKQYVSVSTKQNPCQKEENYTDLFNNILAGNATTTHS